MFPNYKTKEILTFTGETRKWRGPFLGDQVTKNYRTDSISVPDGWEDRGCVATIGKQEKGKQPTEIHDACPRCKHALHIGRTLTQATPRIFLFCLTCLEEVSTPIVVERVCTLAWDGISGFSSRLLGNRRYP